jgi:carboxymethylenebutenolidase
MPISRTVGTDRIVDELIVSFTHTTYVYIILDLSARGLIEIQKYRLDVTWYSTHREESRDPNCGGGMYPRRETLSRTYLLVSPVRKKPKLNNRDQASVLVQIGLLEKGNLPIAGLETAQKVKDEKSIPSNQLIPQWNHNH